MNPRSIGSLLLLALLGCDGSTAPPGPVQGVPVRWGNQARVPTSSTLRSVLMFDEDQVLIFGDSSSIFRSNDGGATWQQQEHQPFDKGGDIQAFDALLLDMVAVGGDPGLTMGRGWVGINGVNWAVQDSAGAPFIDTDLVTGFGANQANNAYFLRSDGMVRRRVGNAAGEADSGHAAPRCLDAIAAGVVVVAGDAGVMRKSVSFADPGSFVLMTSGTGANLHGLQLLSDLRIAACGANGRVVFTNNGDTLAEVLPTPTANTLRAIYFPISPANGWAVGDNGTILKINGTYDAMMDVWTLAIVNPAQTSNTTDDLFAVHFVDDQIGMVVGENGTIRKTINGGANWTDPTANGQGALEILNAVDFEPDGIRGIAVGENATVLRTLDRGVTWTPFATGVPPGTNVRSVSLSRTGGTEKAIICGNGGFVRRNTDPWGVGNWEGPGTAPPAEDYYGVVCWSDNSAIMVGANGVITQTNDLLDAAAADWSWSADVYTGNTTNFRSLCVTSDLIAFACGTGGRLVTSDLLTFPANAWNEITNDVTVPITDPLVAGVDLLSVDAPAAGGIAYLACSDDLFRRVLTPLTAPTVQNGGAVPGVSATNGVALFGSGNLFLAGNRMWLSTDGGLNWTESFTHTKQTMNFVWRRSTNGEVGVACGTARTVLRTDVGGD